LAYVFVANQSIYIKLKPKCFPDYSGHIISITFQQQKSLFSRYLSVRLLYVLACFHLPETGKIFKQESCAIAKMTAWCALYK